MHYNCPPPPFPHTHLRTQTLTVRRSGPKMILSPCSVNGTEGPSPTATGPLPPAPPVVPPITCAPLLPAPAGVRISPRPPSRRSSWEVPAGVGAPGARLPSVLACEDHDEVGWEYGEKYGDSVVVVVCVLSMCTYTHTHVQSVQSTRIPKHTLPPVAERPPPSCAGPLAPPLPPGEAPPAAPKNIIPLLKRTVPPRSGCVTASLTRSDASNTPVRGL